MNNIYELLILAVSVALGFKDAKLINPDLDDATLRSLLRLAEKQNIAHLLSLGLEKAGIVPGDEQLKKSFSDYQIMTLIRHEQRIFELDRISKLFEENKIRHLPLKGSVLNQYYPEAWLRNSCDIDILLDEENIDKAAKLILENFDYTAQTKGSHDMSMFSESGYHLELHYTLVEEGFAKKSYDILSNVWEYSAPKNGSDYCYEMQDSMFYFYHIAHMAKHTEFGGCGIRTFADLWILNRTEKFVTPESLRLTEMSGLTKFWEVSLELCNVWFGDGEYTQVLKKFENYIFHGGMYGTKKNHIMVQQQKKGGIKKYAIYKIFLPYESLKFHYPILQKYKFLTPIMEVRRWCKLIFLGHAKRTLGELKFSSSISKEAAKQTQKFLEDIGLD